MKNGSLIIIVKKKNYSKDYINLLSKEEKNALENDREDPYIVHYTLSLKAWEFILLKGSSFLLLIGSTHQSLLFICLS